MEVEWFESVYKIQTILRDNDSWDKYKSSHSELDHYKIQEVERMLECCNPNKGFFYGYCGHCNEHITMHLKCNGKMCSRCGKSYTDKWVEKAKKKVLNEMHRLVTLTVPSDLRPILKDRWDLLKLLQNSAKRCIEEIAEKVCKKKVKIGMLVGLQTYGKDMKFHPHLHCMVVEKAKYKKQIINFNYIPKDMLRKKWQYAILTNLLKANISYEEKKVVHRMFDQYPNGFITDVGRRSMKQYEVIRYLARYMRHPAIANSRIVSHDEFKVIIKCLDKMKREYYVEFTTDEFITRLLMHIPPKQFKIVRWYGLYSRRDVRLSRKESKQETIWESLGNKKRRFKCPHCKNPIEMELLLPEMFKGPPNDVKLGEKITDWIS